MVGESPGDKVPLRLEQVNLAGDQRLILLCADDILRLRMIQERHNLRRASFARMFRRLIDVLIGLFGRGRATLGEWPHAQVVQAAVATVREFGGEVHRESGTPAGELEVMHFRVCGRLMRLCVEDFGIVTLWGPKQLVADISRRVAERLSRTKT